MIWCSCPDATSAGCQRCATGSFKHQFFPGTFSAPTPSIDYEKVRLAKVEQRADNLDKEIAHLAATVRKVEGAMLEQDKLFRETEQLLELERTLYARKLDELQGLVKRLLEQKG